MCTWHSRDLSRAPVRDRGRCRLLGQVGVRYLTSKLCVLSALNTAECVVNWWLCGVLWVGWVGAVWDLCMSFPRCRFAWLPSVCHTGPASADCMIARLRLPYNVVSLVSCVILDNLVNIETCACLLVFDPLGWTQVVHRLLIVIRSLCLFIDKFITKYCYQPRVVHAELLNLSLIFTPQLTSSLSSLLVL